MTEAVAEVDASACPVRAVLLHRPAPPDDALVRGELNAVLDDGLGGAATLVTAPAGFGKSVIVSQWCETLDRPCAWLSLDPTVDDPRRFMIHLAAAVRRACPDALDVTSQMANATQLPDERTLVMSLSNELDELDEPIVVVLDDYHQITSPAIHLMMSDLLQHPSTSANIVIISRDDPELPTAMLRASGQLKELRMIDLAFSEDEMQLFAEQVLHRALPAEEVRALRESTEGWPVGVRLATEARRVSAAGRPIAGAGFLDRATQEYLVGEVLERVPPEIRRYLLALSPFDRFSAPLCDAVIAGTAPRPPLMTGAEFIDWIRKHNLFIVQLDDTGQWFRFHHVFARLLDGWRQTREVEPTRSDEHVHRIAARLFKDQGMVEDAIRQLGLAGDHAAMAALAADHGFDLIDEERWVELDQIVSMIPADVIDGDAALLLLRAWLLGEVQSRHKEMNILLDRAERILDGSGNEEATPSSELRAQIAELRGAYSKLLKADFEGAIDDARTARRLLAHRPGRNLAFAYVLEVIALAGAGRSAEAHQLAASAVGDERFADAPFDPLTFAMPYLGWLEGDLDAVDRHATQMSTIGKRFGLEDTIAAAHYFLGISAYERNRLQEADEHLAITLDLRLVAATIMPMQAGMALALSAQAQGRGAEADDTAAAMMQHVLDTNSEFHQPVALAFLAELDLRSGRHAAALRWARTADIDAERHRYMFYDLASTLVGALLASPDDAERGRQLLDQTLASATRNHHAPLTIQLLGQQALDLAARGDEERALDALESAVTLSQRAGMVRRLADLGPALVPLVSRLDLTGEVLTHAGTIIAAIQPATTGHDADGALSGSVATVHAGPQLTGRELDVLKLLAERMSNKEIARELYIAPATVKKRTVTLYNKFNVHGRREAVAKARSLGYLD